MAFGTVAIQTVAALVTRLAVAQRGFAVGLATSGSTAGQVFAIPGLAALMTVVGRRWGYAASAVLILLLAFALGLALRRSAAGSAVASPPRLKELVARGSFLWSYPYQALLWSYVICGFTTSGVIETHLLPYAAACGFTAVEGATVYGLLSAINLAGIIIAGWMSDRVERHWLLAVIYTVRAASFLLLMNVVGDYSQLIIFALLFGMADNATIPETIGLLAPYVGVNRLGTSMGILAAGHAAGGALGALLGGVLFDLFAGYAATWWAAFIIAQAAAVLVISIRIVTPPPASLVWA